MNRENPKKIANKLVYTAIAIIVIIILFIGLCSKANAQSTAYRVYSRIVLPTTCSKTTSSVDIVILTATDDAYLCKGSNNWQLIGGGSSLSGSGANTRIAFWNAANTLTSNSGFTFDGTNLSIPTGGQFRINNVAFNFSNLAGNIAVSQMNSGTGASSSTYWRGDGTWASVSSSGGPDTLFSSTTTSGNVLAAETDLHTFTIPANTFANNGYSVRARYAGSILNSSNVIKVYFGGTVIFEHTIGAISAGWDLDCLCVRASTTSVKCVTNLQTNTLSNQNRAQYVTVTGLPDLTANTTIIKVTGTGGSSDEVVLELAKGIAFTD